MPAAKKAKKKADISLSNATQKSAASTINAVQPFDGDTTTVGDFFEQLRPKWSEIESQRLWPPTVFGLCAMALSSTGAYIELTKRQPLKKEKWPQSARRTGHEWHRAIISNEDVPKAVREAWEICIQNKNTRLTELRGTKNKRLWSALFRLVAYADEASFGAGLPAINSRGFRARCQEYLTEAHTLAPDLSQRWIKVLPKEHTPDVGITIRSLTHHLSFVTANETTVNWLWAPTRRSSPRLNLLLIPWPFELKATDFQACDLLPGDSDHIREFQFSPKHSNENLMDVVHRLWMTASENAGPVDVVLFPEMALSPKEFAQISKWAMGKNLTLICGVRDEVRGVSKNSVWMQLEMGSKPSLVKQEKHHRWKLDTDQIEAYELAGVLNPEIDWWESAGIEDRSLSFVSLDKSLTMCCLICEDLARQEPTSAVVRAVAPNLVVALLMDGPQTGDRWPARYATVLADDPGASVLTLTSLGMTMLSKHLRSEKSRVIALWKDKGNKAREIRLDEHCSGAVLNIGLEFKKEHTADGRDDRTSGCFPRLRGVHQIDIRPTAKLKQ